MHTGGPMGEVAGSGPTHGSSSPGHSPTALYLAAEMGNLSPCRAIAQGAFFLDLCSSQVGTVLPGQPSRSQGLHLPLSLPPIGRAHTEQIPPRPLGTSQITMGESLLLPHPLQLPQHSPLITPAAGLHGDTTTPSILGGLVASQGEALRTFS